MHDYHEGQPDYSAEQVLHDGCEECRLRAQSDDHGIAHMDKFTFLRAWARATEWNRNGLPDLACAEMPALNALWAVQLKLENWGLPIGTLPVGAIRVGLGDSE